MVKIVNINDLNADKIINKPIEIQWKLGLKDSKSGLRKSMGNQIELDDENF